MLALPESSNTNPRGHRPGREGSSFSGLTTCSPIGPRFAVMRHRAAPGPADCVRLLLTGCFTGERPSFTTEPFQPGSTERRSVDRQGPRRARRGQRRTVHRGLHGVDQVRQHHPTGDRCQRRPDASIGHRRRRAIPHGRRHVADLHPRQERPVLVDHRPGANQRYPDHPRLLRHRRRQAAATKCHRPDRHTDRHIEQFAGQSATCVDVPVPGGVSVFCVLPNGPLADSTTAPCRSTSRSTHRPSTSRCSPPPR